MPIVLAILGAIPSLLSLILLIVKDLTKTPTEKRNEWLGDLNTAMKKAHDKDPTALSDLINRM